MLYLELGCLPIRYVLMNMRLNYLQYILKQNSESLVKNVLNAQINFPAPHDWINTVRNDMEHLNINLSLENITLMSDYKFKKMIKVSCAKKALEVD